MTDKNEPKTYIIDKFKKSYSSIQEMVAEESRNFAQYAVIIDRLLAEFETYDKIKSLDIKEYAIKIFSELDQLKAECEELLKFNNSLVEEHKTIGNDLYKEIKDYRIKLKTKEEECEKKDKDIKFLLEKLDLANNRIQDCEIYWEKEKKNLKQQLNQLKGEVHHKTEFIQEQRDIIDQLKKNNKELEREIKLKKDFINSLRKHYERKLEEKKLFLPSNYKNLYEETKEMKNDIAKKYFDLEKENKKLKSIIKQAIEDFNLEIGTPQYEILLNKSKELGVIKE